MSTEYNSPDKQHLVPIGCATTIAGGVMGCAVALFSPLVYAWPGERYGAAGVLFIPLCIAGLLCGFVIGLLRENRQLRLKAEANQPPKPKRQFRLATLVVGSLTIGICMPLVLFFLSGTADRGGFGLALAFGISGLLCVFTTLLSEVICAWRDGDEWN